MTVIHRLDISVRNRAAELRERAAAESEQGSIVETVIIVAATAAIAIATMAAIALAVSGKLGSLHL
jgi:hypothetical protein